MGLFKHSPGKRGQCRGRGLEKIAVTPSWGFGAARGDDEENWGGKRPLCPGDIAGGTRSSPESESWLRVSLTVQP